MPPSISVILIGSILYLLVAAIAYTTGFNDGKRK